MSYEVEYTDEFESWWNGLSGEEQESIVAVVGVLEDKGPHLADRIYDERLKEIGRTK